MLSLTDKIRHKTEPITMLKKEVTGGVIGVRYSESCYFVNLKNVIKQHFGKSDYQNCLGRTLKRGHPIMSQPSPPHPHKVKFCACHCTSNRWYQYPCTPILPKHVVIWHDYQLHLLEPILKWRSHLICEEEELMNFCLSVYWPYCYP